MTPFKVAFYVALFVAMPVVLYQIWAFVAPGLYRREKRFAVPLLVSSVVLFYAGVVFAYFVVFPVMFSSSSARRPRGVRYMPDMASYLDFVLTHVLRLRRRVRSAGGRGAAGAHRPREGGKLGENRGYVIIGIFVVAAFLTPPDAISQIIMAVPMYLLYEGGLVMARIMQKMRREAAEAAEKEEAEGELNLAARRARQSENLRDPACRAPCWRRCALGQTRRHRGASAPIKIRGKNK